MTNIIAIAAGSDASVAVNANNRLWQFGSSDGDDEDIWDWGNTNALPALSPQYVDFYNGQLPDLTILNGNNQKADAGLEFPQSLVFQVTNTNGVALSNAPVSVQLIAGDMALRTVSGGTNYQALRLMTDVNGKVTLIGHADQNIQDTNCFIRVLAASGQQLAEVDFIETLVPPPTISITSPLNGNTYLVATDQTLNITVDAQAGAGGSISAVDYYYGTNGSANILLGTSTQSPFSFTWTNASWWSNAFYAQYTLSAVAVDSGGATSTNIVAFFVALDSNGDGLPDYWQLEYFGTLGLDPNSSPDGNGQSLLYDYQNGINPTDYYDGNVPTLEVIDGNDQSGIYGAFLPLPLVVQVTDSYGNILTNAPLTFAVTNGTALLADTNNGTTLSSLSLRTDSNGLAYAWIYFPSASSTPPDSTILVGACSTTNCTDMTANEFVPMAHWTFNNTNTWVGEEGQLPLIATNVVGVPDWSSNAVQIDSASPALMSYDVVETNGSTNINCQIGSVLFWFEPDWSSVNAGGTGPGTWGRLIEMGRYSPAFTNGWWSLYLSTNGNQLFFGTSTNGFGMTNLSATISWNSNEWYQIALTYAPTGSAAFVDGQLLATGSGVTCFPNATELTNGFRIGGDQYGSNQAAGTFDELQTFDYPLNTNNTATFDSALPGWWEVEYFNSNQLNPLTTFGNNQDLLYDYTNGLDPNVIGFTLANTSRYFNSSTATIPVLVTAGVPFYEAVLVNDTNALIGDFSDAVWEPCTSSNITVNLGASNGLYSVWIGLSGLPQGAAPTWQGTQLFLDTNTPVFVITNPTSSTVTQPIIQLEGLVSETLSQLTFDVSNALGVVTNQMGEWTPLIFDTNKLDFTTNFFQCYDIQLTNGINSITLHAMDLAGNSSTTNVSFTLNYSGDTTPPALSILWPTNGTSISGTNFTLQGLLDDDTATVTAQIVDASGNTNAVQALVERNGLVWAQNLPLASGTNVLTITATNAAGLSMTTNLTLVQSSVMVTMNPLTQFNQASVTVTGTISDPTCTLTVNGVQATVYTNGCWCVNSVPVSPTGTAVFNVQVFTGDPVQIGSQNFSQPQPPTVGLMSYSGNSYSQRALEEGAIDGFPSTVTVTLPNGDIITIATPDSVTLGLYELSSAENWNYLSGGTESGYGELTPAYQYLDNYPVFRGDQTFTNSSSTSIPAGPGSFSANWENASYGSAYYDFEGYDDFYPFVSFGNFSYFANADVMIEPSGQAAIGQKVLYIVKAQVSGEHGSPTPPLNTVTIQGQTLTIVTNSDGSIWGETFIIAPAGAYENVTPDPVGSYNCNVTALTPQIIANGVQLDPDKVAAGADFCVGQGITFSVSGLVPGTAIVEARWTLPGTFVNTNSDPNCNLYYTGNFAYLTAKGSSSDPLSTLCWYVQDAQNAQASVQVAVSAGETNKIINFVPITGKFNVYRPTTTFIPPSSLDGNATAMVTNGDLTLGWNRFEDMSFGHNVNPGNFSGKVGYTQLASGSYSQSSTGNTADIEGDNGIPDIEFDKGEFYYGESSVSPNTSTRVTWWDGPGIGLYEGNGAMNVNFSTYLMFEPDIGPGTNNPGPNIWVPLRKVTWTLNDAASGGALESTGGSPVTGPSDGDETTFPDITNTFSIF